MLIPSLTSAITVPAESYQLVHSDSIADVTNNDMKSDINRGPGDINGDVCDVKNGDAVDKIYVERVVDTKNLNSSSVKLVIPPLNPGSGAIPAISVHAESHELLQSHKDNVTNDDIGSEGANHITREENHSCSNDTRNDDTGDTARDMGDTSDDRSDDSEKIVDSTKLNLDTVTQEVLIPPVNGGSGVPPVLTGPTQSYKLVQNPTGVTDTSNNHTADGDVLNALGAACGDAGGDAVGDAHDDMSNIDDDTHDSSNTASAYEGSDMNDYTLDCLGNGELVDTFDDAVDDAHDDTSDDEGDDDDYDDSCDDTEDSVDDGDAFYSSLLQL